MAVAPNPEYLQTLLETFKCFICMEKIQDAHLCPHCSKLCCYSCMRRWLTEQRSQCPHCRATLHLHEIVNCRWVEDLSDQLDCLNSTVNIGSIRQSQEQRCETHNEQLSVFCMTCNTTICHRCALFDDSAHNGHSFRPVEDIYNETIAQLGESFDHLKTKEELIKKDIKEIDRNIKQVQQAKDQKVREIRTAVECMMIDLEKDLNNKLTTLLTQKNQLVNDSEQLEEFLHDCDLEVSRMPMSQLINNAPRFKRTISAMEDKPFTVLMSVYPDFHSELIPKFEGGNLIIKSFSDKMIQSEPIYSLPIGCNGVSWRLKVYPNGNGIVRDRYLSVFLELTSGPAGVSRYDYRIEMVNQLDEKLNDNSKNVLREFTSDFEIGECWGYNRFFRLDMLINEGFLHQDTLNLKFSVRPPTYYQKCREQQWYLSKLELERSVLLQQFEELKQKIPAKVKPISKEIPSPKKKLKIKIQSLLDEFECAEATGHLRSPIKDQEVQAASCETASNMVHPPLSIQTLYDNEFQNRFQGETAQSMFERLSRLFEESDNPDRPSPMHGNNVNSIILDNIEHTSPSDFRLENCLRKVGESQLSSPNKLISESSSELASSSDPINLRMSENVLEDLSRQTMIVRGLHNPIVNKNEQPVTQETTNTNLSNRFLDMSDISDDLEDLINSVFVDNAYIDNWEVNQSSSAEEVQSPNNESLCPDHLTRDE
ncbi:E3 ubiquitin-protein ligase TRIM37 isoform X2 [Acyrthosiphon pisum]|uniref:E3 ubiquitin-protein ligase TRIM37 n=1 Tax=Acyrthosiphon pisum TaxID=7029 RepID=A0A8R2A8C5_ACYPI|nr:E3 ubiquitin-protein ligase TRIM37 isoform X2 [Acyrthosiphon pisum]|eukprot:XP_003245868.1 PREDICTED: E3 ubiquitin-protein ligase TRIM37 isoform X2 [Acyrthosiphon pisum]